MYVTTFSYHIYVMWEEFSDILFYVLGTCICKWTELGVGHSKLYDHWGYL